MSYSKLLDFEENNPELMSYRNEEGFLFWPLIRFTVMQEYLNVVNGFHNPHAQKSVKNLGSLLKYFWDTFSRGFFFAPKRPVAILSTGAVVIRQGDSFINRLYDFYLETNSNRISLFEASVRKEYRLPRTRKVWSYDSITLFSSILGKFKPLSQADLSNVESLISFLKKNFPIKLTSYFLDETKTMLIALLRRINYTKSIVSYFVNRCCIKVVIIEDASYGADKALLIAAFRNNGVKVLEYQHGLVAANHPAYSYCSSIVNRANGYYNYLPDYLLTFGRYWSEIVKTPSMKVVCGYPYLANILKKLPSNPAKKIIVISDGTQPEYYVILCKYLINNLGDTYTTVFKPHPAETPMIENRYGELIGKLEIVTNQTIYELLKNQPILVGFGSTVMVEALAFGIHPYVYDTSYTAELYTGLPFVYFKNESELVMLIRHRADQKIESTSEMYWSNDLRVFESLMDNLLV